MKIWKILPHKHMPGRTWFAVTVLKSICQKCGRDIIRRHDLKWIRLDKNYIYMLDSGDRMTDRYGIGDGKKETNSEGGFINESIGSDISK